MDTMTASERRDLATLTKAWWLPVVVGVLLLLYSFVILSFTIRTVWAISIALGVGLILAGIGTLITWRSATSLRWLVLFAGLLDIALGITALAWPEATFLVLVRLVSWVLLFKGVIDLVQGFEAKHIGAEGWWVLLLLGVFNIGLAVWASRYPERSAALLVLWVGLSLMTRAVAAIATGFALRSVRTELRAT